MVDLKVKPGEIYSGEPKGNKADCTLTLDDADMVALVRKPILFEGSFFQCVTFHLLFTLR